MKLTIPQQCCYRLLRLMAAPKKSVTVDRLLKERDGSGERYIGHIRSLEAAGYVRTSRQNRGSRVVVNIVELLV